MNVKEAIVAAKSYVRDVFAGEQLMDLGLEETEYDEGDKNWLITLGFSRPWNGPRTHVRAMLDAMGSDYPRTRTYKVLTVDTDGKVIAMKNRQVADTVG